MVRSAQEKDAMQDLIDRIAASREKIHALLERL